MKTNKLARRIVFAAHILVIFTMFAHAQPGPVAFYPFSGNANDASGNGNDGTVYGATPTTDRFGNANSAYNFDGSAYIEIPNSSTLSVANLANGYTVSAWIKSSTLPTALERVQAIVNKEDSNFKLWMTHFDEGVYFSAYHREETITSYSFNNTSLALSAGTWYHAAITWEGPGGDWILWVNGGSPQLPGVTPATLNQTPTDDGPVLIGKTFLTIPQYFIGAIDEVKIWDRALSAAEIMELYNAAPVAAGDSYTTDEDTPLSVAAPGVLGNDSDAEPGTLSVISIDTTGTTGAVSFGSDGSLTYDPEGWFDALPAGSITTDTFAYTVSDSMGGTGSATVTITVAGVNDAPEAPSGLLCDSLPNPNNVTDYTPLLSWIFTDVDDSAPSAFHILIRDASSLVVHDATYDPSASTSFEAPAGLSANEQYTWSVQVKDQYGWSGFSTEASFTILDIGLRMYDGTQIIKVAVDYVNPSHELRIHKDGTTYGIILVDPADPDASNIRIQTASGLKAFKKMR